MWSPYNDSIVTSRRPPAQEIGGHHRSEDVSDGITTECDIVQCLTCFVSLGSSITSHLLLTYTTLSVVVKRREGGYFFLIYCVIFKHLIKDLHRYILIPFLSETVYFWPIILLNRKLSK